MASIIYIVANMAADRVRLFKPKLILIKLHGIFIIISKLPLVTAIVTAVELTCYFTYLLLSITSSELKFLHWWLKRK